MKKKLLSAAFAAAMVASVGVGVIGAGQASAAPAEKVTICHSTGSATNPFVVITVSGNSLNAHGAHHDGADVIPADECGYGGGED